MNIQVDSREHKSEWERIKKQFDDLGIEYRSAQSVSEDNYWDMIDHKIDDLKEGRW